MYRGDPPGDPPQFQGGGNGQQQPPAQQQPQQQQPQQQQRPPPQMYRPVAVAPQPQQNLINPFILPQYMQQQILIAAQLEEARRQQVAAMEQQRQIEQQRQLEQQHRLQQEQRLLEQQRQIEQQRLEQQRLEQQRLMDQQRILADHQRQQQLAEQQRQMANPALNNLRAQIQQAQANGSAMFVHNSMLQQPGQQHLVLAQEQQRQQLLEQQQRQQLAAAVQQVQQQQQAAQSPNANAIARQEQDVRVRSALTYLEDVKRKFIDGSETYTQFLDVMKEFKAHRINTNEVVGRVGILFQHHPELILGFNAFLPAGCAIRMHDNVVALHQENDQHPNDPNEVAIVGVRPAPQLVQQPSTSQPQPVAVPAAAPAAEDVEMNDHGSTEGNAGEDDAEDEDETNEDEEFEDEDIYEDNDVDGKDVMELEPWEKQGEKVFEFFTQLQQTYAENGSVVREVLDLIYYLMRIGNEKPIDEEEFDDSDLTPSQREKAKKYRQKLNSSLMTVEQRKEFVLSAMSRILRGNHELIKMFTRLIPFFASYNEHTDSDFFSLVDTFITTQDNKDWGKETKETKEEKMEEDEPASEAMDTATESSSDEVVEEGVPDALKTMKWSEMNVATRKAARNKVIRKMYKRKMDERKERSEKFAKASKDALKSVFIADDAINHKLLKRIDPQSARSLQFAMGMFLDGSIDLQQFFKSIKDLLSIRYGDVEQQLRGIFGMTTKEEESDREDMYVATDDEVSSEEEAIIPSPRKVLSRRGLASSNSNLVTEQNEQKKLIEAAQAAKEKQNATISTIGLSYRTVNRKDRLAKCSGKSKLSESVLNNTLASYATWNSEDNGNVIAKKSPYEEFLYRTEDERFELDICLDGNRYAIEVLQMLQRKFNTMTAHEKEAYQLDENYGASSGALMFRAFRRIYGEAGKLMIKGFRQQPYRTYDMILQRMTAKEIEWKETQMEMNTIWREQLEKQAVRALDHQTANVRAADTKLLKTKLCVQQVEAVLDAAKQTTVNPPDFEAHVLFQYPSRRQTLHDVNNLIIHYLKRQSTYTKEEKKKVKLMLRRVVLEWCCTGLEEMSDDEKDLRDLDIERKTNRKERRIDKQVDLNLQPSIKNRPDLYVDKKWPLMLNKYSETYTRDWPSNNCRIEKFATQQRSGRYRMFYGDDNLYLFMRFHHTICDRLMKLTIAHRRLLDEHFRGMDADHSWRDALEKNPAKVQNRDPKWPDLTEAIRTLRNETRPLDEYYRDAIKDIKRFLDGDMDAAAFEDSLRAYFPTEACLFLNIDKFLSAMTKQLVLLANHEDDCRALRLYTKYRSKSPSSNYREKDDEEKELERQYTSAAENRMLKKNLYRFEFIDSESPSLTINLVEVSNEVDEKFEKIKKNEQSPRKKQEPKRRLPEEEDKEPREKKTRVILMSRSNHARQDREEEPSTSSPPEEKETPVASTSEEKNESVEIVRAGSSGSNKEEEKEEEVKVEEPMEVEVKEEEKEGEEVRIPERCDGTYLFRTLNLPKDRRVIAFGIHNWHFHRSSSEIGGFYRMDVDGEEKLFQRRNQERLHATRLERIEKKGIVKLWDEEGVKLDNDSKFVTDKSRKLLAAKNGPSHLPQLQIQQILV